MKKREFSKDEELNANEELKIAKDFHNLSLQSQAVVFNLMDNPEVLSKVMALKSGFMVIKAVDKMSVVEKLVESESEYQRIFDLNPRLIDYVPAPAKFLENKDNAIKFVKSNGLNLKHVPLFANDKDVVGAAIESIPATIAYAGDEIKNDREFLTVFFNKYPGAVGLQKSIPLLSKFENDHSESIEEYFVRIDSKNKVDTRNKI